MVSHQIFTFKLLHATIYALRKAQISLEVLVPTAQEKMLSGKKSCSTSLHVGTHFNTCSCSSAKEEQNNVIQHPGFSASDAQRAPATQDQPDERKEKPMNMPSASSSFKDVFLAKLPKQYVRPEDEPQFADIAQRFDLLGRIDPHTQQIVIDEPTLRSLLETHLPAGVAAHCMSALKAAPGSAFSTGGTQHQTSPLGWQQLSAETRKRMKPPTIDDGQLGPSPTAEQIIQTFKQAVPGVPDQLFDPKTFRDRLLAAAGASSIPAANEDLTAEMPSFNIGSIWNCLVSNLGFWGALAVVTLVIAIASAIGTALVVSGGTLGVAFWAAFWPALAIAGAAGASLYLISVVIMCMGY